MAVVTAQVASCKLPSPSKTHCAYYPCGYTCLPDSCLYSASLWCPSDGGPSAVTGRSSPSEAEPSDTPTGCYPSPLMCCLVQVYTRRGGRLCESSRSRSNGLLSSKSRLLALRLGRVNEKMARATQLQIELASRAAYHWYDPGRTDRCYQAVAVEGWLLGSTARATSGTAT